MTDWTKAPDRMTFALALADAVFEDISTGRRRPFEIAVRRAAGLADDAPDEEVLAELVMQRLDSNARLTELALAEALRRRVAG